MPQNAPNKARKSIFLEQPDNSWSFTLRQNAGLGLVGVSAICLVFGYDRGIISNGWLSMLCLALALVALFLHETRPFQRWENITAEVEHMKKERESAALRKQD